MDMPITKCKAENKKKTMRSSSL